MTTRYKYHFQLVDKALGAFAGPPITGAGGVVKVCVAGSPLKAAITDKDGAAASNVASLTRGAVTFYSVETSVDLFVQAPDGQFVALYGVKPSDVNEIPVDRYNPNQVMVVPFHITDFPANTETDTGFDITTTMAMLPNPVLQITAIDTGIVLDVGTDGSGSNDPDGLIEDGVMDALGLVVPKVTNSAKTLGALLYVQDSANAGDEAPSAFAETTSENLTITPAASADTCAGYVILPYLNLSRNQPTLT